MFYVQQQINEATPTKVHAKRCHSQVVKSPTNDQGDNKRYAAAFSYDKSFHVYESPALHLNEYTYERTDKTYRVNVRNAS